jgi:hypothetical protein
MSIGLLTRLSALHVQPVKIQTNLSPQQHVHDKPRLVERDTAIILPLDPKVLSLDHKLQQANVQIPEVASKLAHVPGPRGKTSYPADP